MKKWLVSLFVGSLFMMLVLKFSLMKNPIGETPGSNSVTFNGTNPTTISPLNWIKETSPPAVKNQDAINKVMSTQKIVSSLFRERRFTDEVKTSLQTWNLMNHLVNYSHGLPNAFEAVKEAQVAWDILMKSFEEKQNSKSNESSVPKSKEKQCPYFVNKINATEFGNVSYRLRIPCGLIQGSSFTIIGTPNGLLGNFQIDLAGEPVPREADPPLILHYNVRLLGDKITEDPVIVQNTWTAAQDWGAEERCPSLDPAKNKKVDELSQCNNMVGKDGSQKVPPHSSNISTSATMTQNKSKARRYFPFKQGYVSVMTLRMAEEGIQMTVDGRHITSFSYRESLEPWLVSEVRISGDLDLISVLASGLPTSENIEQVVDLESLKSIPLAPKNPLDLFIGVFSTANNFKRRMAVRRTWMQYDAVRSGRVAVRFFVGLHKNKMVNEELWNEALTYRDIQLVPFVDYYSLITWKTVAICIFGTEVVSAKYVMKTDDDSFVRVDEVLASLNRTDVSTGLLYGLINSDSQPHRNSDSKWYISPQEWAEETYPPWAHGPGYVVSNDIAKEVYNRHKEGRLKMFKLEDVAMGIWIAEMKKGGLNVTYAKEERIHNMGCKNDYVVAHYQSPRYMLCLWQKLREANKAICC